MSKNVHFDKDIRPFDTVCWVAIQYEDLQDIKKNSRLAVKIQMAAAEHHSEFHDNYVAAAQIDAEESFLEVDGNAAVSTTDKDYGAYVMAWRWVDSEKLNAASRAENYKARRQFINDILLPTPKPVLTKKDTNGKKESGQKGNRKGKAQSQGKSKASKIKPKSRKAKG